MLDSNGDVSQSSTHTTHILDLTMPKMDGYDILKQIRSASLFDNLKIFVLTSGTYEYDRIKSIAYGGLNGQ
ncbi:MAG TPA: response regulator [Bacteroidia bacterium]|nr:response regulator [Bacteroidia bacterium]